ncbi:MAG: type restriction enzyme subunit [Patescibacteria group bacterium]|nr:type restriction enzyme subunit [Patescibacteria group bacterium]MDQ5971640.1 type restriction enzyme subunit [Patescibacteria group bacterium]
MQTLKLTKKYETYPECKDSGVDWLGKIPKDWGLEKLKNKFNFEKGKDAAKFTQDYIGHEKNIGNYPVYSGQTENNGIMGNINSYEYDLSAPAIFTTTVGAKAMTPLVLNGKFNLSQNCLLMVPKNRDTDSRFFYYQLFGLFKSMKDEIPSHMQPSLRVSDLNKSSVVYISPENQTKISNYLDEKTKNIDQIIEKKQKLIELLREKRTTIINNAVTKFNVEGRTGKIKHLVKSIESGIWGDNPLENYDDIKCLRVADFDYENLSFSQVETIRNNPNLSKKKILKKGDILVEKSGGGEKTPVGRAILFNSDEKMVCANFIDIIRVNTDKILPEFLVFYLSYIYSGRINTKYIKQNTGIQNMDIKTYFSEMITIPDLNTQKDIIITIYKKMNIFDSALKKVEKSLETLQEFKSSLISNVVTGKVKI